MVSLTICWAALCLAQPTPVLIFKRNAGSLITQPNQGFLTNLFYGIVARYCIYPGVEMNEYVIASFYRFVSLEDCEALKISLLTMMQEKGIKGTIILASEGINGSICAHAEEVDAFFDFLNQDSRLANLPSKKNLADFIPFDKAKVKLRKEIVSMGVEGINPAEATGINVKPDEWNTLISDPDVLLIDTRNDYEVLLGTFRNAINPRTVNFRDFPQYVSEHLADKKHKKIAMCCTGGIRCEKSTAYLMSLGFEQVYQLEGGILNYLENTPKEESLWEGACFVFDDRMAVDGQLNAVEKGLIDSDWKHKNRTMLSAAQSEG